MADRHLPVRPNLDQLRHQAKDLLRDVRRGDPASIAVLRKHGPRQREPEDARLADAQRALARSYGLPNWPRLVLACWLTDAICRDDAAAVNAIPRSLACCWNMAPIRVSGPRCGSGYDLCRTSRCMSTATSRRWSGASGSTTGPG